MNLNTITPPGYRYKGHSGTISRGLDKAIEVIFTPGEEAPPVPMHLKMRPMSEAPIGVPLLLADPNRPSGWTYGEFSNRDSMHKFNGFYAISDLLRAAEIVAAITPEGCVYAMAHCKYPLAERPTVEVTFHRLAPPVEYRYECAEDPKRIEVGEYFLSGGKFILANEALVAVLDKPVHCYRRVEVKR